jgi:hypothetical protein
MLAYGMTRYRSFVERDIAISTAVGICPFHGKEVCVLADALCLALKCGIARYPPFVCS